MYVHFFQNQNYMHMDLNMSTLENWLELVSRTILKKISFHNFKTMFNKFISMYKTGEEWRNIWYIAYLIISSIRKCLVKGIAWGGNVQPRWARAAVLAHPQQTHYLRLYWLHAASKSSAVKATRATTTAPNNLKNCTRSVHHITSMYHLNVFARDTSFLRNFKINKPHLQS